MNKLQGKEILMVIENNLDLTYSYVKDIVDTFDEHSEEMKKADIRIAELEEQVDYYAQLYEEEKALNLQLQNRMDLDIMI